MAGEHAEVTLFLQNFSYSGENFHGKQEKAGNVPCRGGWQAVFFSLTGAGFVYIILA